MLAIQETAPHGDEVLSLAWRGCGLECTVLVMLVRGFKLASRATGLCDPIAIKSFSLCVSAPVQKSP